MIIDDILKEKNMSRYQLWKQSGLSQATIYDLCNERIPLAKCRIDTLTKLATVLDVSVETLLPGGLEKREMNRDKKKYTGMNKKAYEEGIKEGYKKQLKESISKLMSHMGITYEEACVLLGVEDNNI